MGYVLIGYCPRCGAPMYSPSEWYGVTPPPIIKTCNCFGGEVKTNINSG